jgi:AraC family transcriptional regulator, transcriptional activator of pobA
MRTKKSLLGKKPIPEYNHFNHSLAHLHLPATSLAKLFHVFKWNYTEDLPIHYPSSRQNYFDITFFVRAKFTHHLNTDAYPMVNHSLHLLTPGQVEQFETTTLERESGYGIYFMSDYIFRSVSKQKIEKDLPFLKHGNRNVFYFTPAESLILQQIFETMIAESSFANDDIVSYYLFILLHKIKSFTENKESVPAYNRSSKKLVFQFESLLKQHYLEQTNISSYAKMLHVTARQLADTIQKETGKTPKQLLNEAILLEAKLLLRHSNLSVSEIAWHFNFHDVPHFTKFFTKTAGVSPQQFRKQNSL